MSNADSRHSTRTTEGVDLGLASQIHFFFPSLKVGHKGKAFLDSEPRVHPVVSPNEFTHLVGSCLLVWHSAIIFQSRLPHLSEALPTHPVKCSCSMTASFAGPFRMDFGAKSARFYVSSWDMYRWWGPLFCKQQEHPRILRKAEPAVVHLI